MAGQLRSITRESTPDTVAVMMSAGSAYDVLNYNCQVWADHVRAMYRLLIGARQQGVQQGRVR